MQWLVTKSTVFVKFGDAGNSPPKYNPLVALENEQTPDLATVKSPKSNALPIDIMVTYCMTLILEGDSPLAITHLVGDDVPVT